MCVFFHQNIRLPCLKNNKKHVLDIYFKCGIIGIGMGSVLLSYKQKKDEDFEAIKDSVI